MTANQAAQFLGIAAIIAFLAILTLGVSLLMRGMSRAQMKKTKQLARTLPKTACCVCHSMAVQPADVTSSNEHQLFSRLENDRRVELFGLQCSNCGHVMLFAPL